MDDLTMGMTLCENARLGKLEALEDLIRCGCDPSASDYDRRTPLHVAAAEGQKTIAQSLLDSGCQADARDRWGNTPQSEAERSGQNWPGTFWDSATREVPKARRKS